MYEIYQIPYRVEFTPSVPTIPECDEVTGEQLFVVQTAEQSDDKTTSLPRKGPNAEIPNPEHAEGGDSDRSSQRTTSDEAKGANFLSPLERAYNFRSWLPPSESIVALNIQQAAGARYPTLHTSPDVATPQRCAPPPMIEYYQQREFIQARAQGRLIALAAQRTMEQRREKRTLGWFPSWSRVKSEAVKLMKRFRLGNANSINDTVGVMT
jgi:hypothetical protein